MNGGEQMHCGFPYDLRRVMTMLVCITLTDEYDFGPQGKIQPSVNIDDLLYSTLHLLAVCSIAFSDFGWQAQLE
ncbi:uncharacterized protein N7473_013205 [Penicillium subrubescens]|uniref:uncharacterized protein n=1 Tax=Penicillium subrubescens TaxID=1316194 RepID=UPI002544FA38|nr:uncharacterized protein N7473_013205 [Penicillium subrubescens]KAJ5873646.1 hypothetical protein N7473_013205 [Penicillium subrubescens]